MAYGMQMKQYAGQRGFRAFPGFKKQKRIVKLGLTADNSFFSVRMLNAIQVFKRGLEGANPDTRDAENQWLKNRGMDSKK